MTPDFNPATLAMVPYLWTAQRIHSEFLCLLSGPMLAEALLLPMQTDTHAGFLSSTLLFDS